VKNFIKVFKIKDSLKEFVFKKTGRNKKAPKGQAYEGFYIIGK